ncbi:hypothetical protein M3Y94_00744200 [Aphelenchoides besseyi]|nr:hypothetical protein M3Y94_00744200 [Aphelenchoides besseyi]KAI6232018.1 Nitric oxide synthase-interacting protein-like protein [Aphelenchoides besseyi]
MTRHGKNATASSVYSASERKKDSKQSGYGTLKERLSADAIKPFDCCSLTLQICKNPMITPDGYIFDREAILQYIVDQKKEQKRLMKAYEKYMEMEETRKAESANAEFESKRRKFMALESTPAHIFAQNYQQPSGSKRKHDNSGEEGSRSKKNKDDSHESLSNMAGEKAKEWKSFWVPQLATSVESERVEKPSGKILNPLSGKPIKFKDMMPVVFTPVSEEAKTARVHSMVERYKCPITHDVLTNSGRAAYIKPSQQIVSWRSVEKIIRKDMIDPITNTPLQESDIIELVRGGTGFAATNQIEAKVARPQLELS